MLAVARMRAGAFAGACTVAVALVGLGAAAAHDKKLHGTPKPAPVAVKAIEAATPPVFPIEVDSSFSLIDHTGQPVSDQDFRGAYILVFFGYANCPGICPTGLRAMTGAIDLLGEAGARLTPLLITVDPAHDTPEALAEAVPKIHPRLIGLTGTREALDAAAKGYKVSAKPAGRSWQGIDIIDHGSYVYLIGPDGAFLTLFPPIVPPEQMAAAIRKYMR